MYRILIVEDDNDINEFLKDSLENNGFVTQSAYSGTEGIMLFSSNNFDLVLLDLMLPGKTGVEVLKEIRTKSKIPVIMLTAVADKTKTVELLRLGANDYVTKPFDNDELLARIEVQLSNHSTDTDSDKLIRYKDIVLDEANFKAQIKDKDLELSKIEFEILRVLIKHPNKVFTKDSLYESVWKGEYIGDDNTINVHISKLRAKLAKINPDAEYIKTVWGIGFKMA